MNSGDPPAASDRRHRNGVGSAIRKSNYGFLFAALSLLLIVGPALNELLPPAASSAIIGACFFGTMLVGVWSLVHSVAAFRVGLGLAAVAIAALFIDWFYGNQGLPFGPLLAMMAFLILSVYHAGRDVIFSGVVTVNRLIGAVCIYEMLGLIWAILFACITIVSPNAFGADSLNASSPFWEFVYFSFVTLTTLGYGDVSPVGGIAKSLAYLEAVAGQFYVAILVASLVGSFIAGNQRK